MTKVRAFPVSASAGEPPCNVEAEQMLLGSVLLHPAEALPPLYDTSEDAGRPSPGQDNGAEGEL